MEYSYEEIGRKGRFVKVKSARLQGIVIIVLGRLLRTARLKEEEYQDLEDPDKFIEELRKKRRRPDIFTFIQRFPDTEPKFAYRHINQSLAVLAVRDYREWLEKQVDSNTRRAIERAKKKGIELKYCSFNEDFIKGMVEVLNDSPIRQGKAFWHYGKDFDTVKQEFAKNLFREEIIGAFHEGQLVGFIFLSNAGKYAIPNEILAKISQKDKAVTNALMAKAVEYCISKSIPYIIYGVWKDDGVTEFKRRNGFVKADIPRYYVPLTWRGKIALRMGLHQGIKEIVPKWALLPLYKLRSSWIMRKHNPTQ